MKLVHLIFLLIKLVVVEPVMCRVRATCDMRLGPVFSKGADHTSDDRSGSEKEIPIRRVANFKDDYAEDDLKLRGSTAYDVLILRESIYH